MFERGEMQLLVWIPEGDTSLSPAVKILIAHRSDHYVDCAVSETVSQRIFGCCFGFLFVI